MGDILNLRQARKQKARSVAEYAAAENRVKYGRSKIEKVRDQKAAKQERRRLDQAKLPEDN